jgi:hypothetical protein
MVQFVTHKQVGILLSVAACALVVGTQVKSLTQRSEDRALSTELGLESAWPHLRLDFSR